MKDIATLKRLGLSLMVSLLVWGLMVGCLGMSGGRSGQLSYTLPTVITVRVGEDLPGTAIRYERMDDRGAYLIIEGQSALKRTGDSVTWEGTPVSGVTVDLSLRVVWFTEDELNLAGTARVVIEDAEPAPGPVLEAARKYTGPVAYRVRRDAAIPGSSLVYAGYGEEGARFEGIEGYPFRRSGDSLLWEGTLRQGVHSRLELRVIQYDEEYLHVGGVVTLWIES